MPRSPVRRHGSRAGTQRGAGRSRSARAERDPWTAEEALTEQVATLRGERDQHAEQARTPAPGIEKLESRLA
jgi:hypothetical protein